MSFFYILFKLLKIEKNIYVFNFLLSTNLYPKLTYKTLEKLNKYLLKNYPDRAIIFRSINTTLTKNIYKNLLKLGFLEIASRQIFYFDDNKKVFNNKSFKEDKRAFEKMKFHIKNKNFTDEEIKQIKNCYDELYIKKYSSYNPQFTEKFYKNILNNKYFKINALINKDIEAVYGYYSIENISTTPIFGYILNKNGQNKLYRQITYLVLKEVLGQNNILHHSSGVGQFKLNRGAKMDIEYMFFYYKHLNTVRKIPWKILNVISRKIIEKELKNKIF